MVYGDLTKEEILERISKIDRQVEEYEEKRERRYSKKCYEFWK